MSKGKERIVCESGASTGRRVGPKALNMVFEDTDSVCLFNDVVSSLDVSPLVMDLEGRVLYGSEEEEGNEYSIRVTGRRIGRLRSRRNGEVLATLLAHLACMEWDRGRLGQVNQTRLDEMARLRDLVMRLSGSVDKYQLSRILAETAMEFFRGGMAYVTLMDEAAGGPVITASVPEGLEDSSLPEGLGEIGTEARCPTRPLILNRRPDLGGVGKNDPGREDGPVAEDGPLLSLLAAPFISRGRIIGGVTVIGSGPDEYSSVDLDFLTSFASHASPSLESARLYDKLDRVLRIAEDLVYLNDVDSILDKILQEARDVTNADAGSIYLVSKGELVFSYVHNDTLFSKAESNRGLYSSLHIPVDHESIVGHAALSGEMILIDDVYNLPMDQDFHFNDAFDRQSGYRTRSLLTIPLKTQDGRLVGVLQLINAKNIKGEVVPFTPESGTYIPILASNAAVALDRALMNRERVMRMMKLAEMRDPAETGAHVQRVGAYAAEIYQRWAVRQGRDIDEVKAFRDSLRLAAMMHDVGKVGISDSILKKPGKLTRDEFETMQWHTILGARLFEGSTSPLDRMCRDIAMHHHERWDGKGYPGVVEGDSMPGGTLAGEDIPIAARVTALADVYDALCSKRVYKDAWEENDVLDTIRKETGSHFDPEVVASFFDIYDVITAIGRRYKD